MSEGSGFVTTDPQTAARFVQSMDQRAIVLELSAIGRELDDLSHSIAVQDEASVRAWSAHRRAYAKAFLTAEGAAEVRKQKATAAVEDERMTAEGADQVLRAARERIRVLRDRLEIGRSVNAAMRSQFAAEAVGQS